MHAHFGRLWETGKAGKARTPEEFYGFRPKDVVEMHFHKHGFGRGVWYRLKDGRVIEAGLTDRVLDDPREPYTQLLVSSILQV